MRRGFREAGARGLDAHGRDRALVQCRGDMPEADAALVADDRDRPVGGKSPPAVGFVGGDRLLDRAHAELQQAGQRGPRLRLGPAAIGVHVEGGRGQRLADRPHRRDVELGLAPDLDLEHLDAEPPVRLDGVGRHRGRRAERRHLRDRGLVAGTARRRRAGDAQQQTREIPRRDVERRPGHAVGVRPRGAGRQQLGAQRAANQPRARARRGCSRRSTPASRRRCTAGAAPRPARSGRTRYGAAQARCRRRRSGRRRSARAARRAAGTGSPRRG